MNARRLPSWVVSTLTLGAAFVVWEIAVRVSSPPTLLPGPVAALRALGRLAASGRLPRDIVASLFRVTWGYLLAVVVGVPAGAALGWSTRSARAFGPVIEVLRPISPLAWIPLAILWLGVGDGAAVFLIFVAAVLPITVAAAAAVRAVPAVHIDAARNFGLGRVAVLRRVLLPGALPQLLVGLRIALGIAWLVVVAAEMLATDAGLGYLIIDARNAGKRYDLVVAGMLLVGAIGLLLDVCLRALERLPALRWGFRA